MVWASRLDAPEAVAARDFFEFVRSYDSRGVGEEAKYIGHFLRKWLEEGNGVAATGGKYEHYLRSVLEIADLTISGSYIYDFQDISLEPSAWYERKVVGLYKTDADSEFYLSPMLYDVAAYRCQRTLPTALTQTDSTS